MRTLNVRKNIKSTWAALDILKNDSQITDFHFLKTSQFSSEIISMSCFFFNGSANRKVFKKKLSYFIFNGLTNRKVFKKNFHICLNFICLNFILFFLMILIIVLLLSTKTKSVPDYLYRSQKEQDMMKKLLEMNSLIRDASRYHQERVKYQSEVDRCDAILSSMKKEIQSLRESIKKDLKEIAKTEEYGMQKVDDTGKVYERD